MGLFVGKIRKHELLQEKSKLHWQMLNITNAKANATKAATEMMQVGTDYEADSLVYKKLEERKYKLKLLEEKLDTQKDEIQHRIEEVETEIKSVDEMIKSAIQESFSYNMGGGR
jgi:DNA repair ATPase RecN